MAQIVFIGLGHMGLPMAVNLLKAGHQVTGYDIQAEMRTAFHQAGGQVIDTLQDIGQPAIVITMLQTGEQVKQVCLNDKGLFANAAPNTLFIDCSSIDVASSREFHKQAVLHGHLAVDSPVSGGVAGAEAATLTMMAGGSLAAFNKAQPILSAMGQTIIHAGEAGTGQAAKICNNMILGISMIAVSEAFLLAGQLGLDAAKLHEVVTHSSGQCWAMSRYVPVAGLLDDVPANRDYAPGFTSAMMLKDLNLSQDAARMAGIQAPLGKHAQQLYQQFNDSGSSQLDFSAIIHYLRALHQGQ